MLPVLYKFVFDTQFSQVMLYVFCVGLVAYAAWSGWRGAPWGKDGKGQPVEPTREERKSRAIKYALGGVALSFVGMYYSLKSVPLIGAGKGEGIPIHTYGVLVGGGFIAAVTVGSWLAQREWPGELGLKRRDQFLDMSFYLFIGAMVGSRVLFIIVNWKDYSNNLGKIFDLGGGLVFYGGLIGASLTAYWYAKKNDIEFPRLADLAMPTVSLGQALGRLGCFGAGCCWGDVAPQGTKLAVHFPGPAAQNLFGGPAGTASLAWQTQSTDQRWVLESTGQIFHEAVPGAIRISEWATQHGHTLGVWPTQLFESAGQLALFALLLFMRRYRRFHGQIFGMWLIAYAILRTSVELFRGDVERGTLHGLLNYLGATGLAAKVPLEAWYNVSTSQFISICMFALGATVLYRGFKGWNDKRPSIDVGSLQPSVG